MESWFQRAVLDGGIMMIFLLPCSVLALGHIIQGFVSLRRDRLTPRRLVQLTLDARDPEEIDAARRRIASDPTPLGRIVAQLGRLRPPEGEPLEREADRLAGEEALVLYHRWVSPLITLRNVALYLGLLGTIFGIMKAFGQFAAGEHQDVELLGRGISEALVTTAWGLSIAIPCLVFVHVFRHRLITLERATFPEVALSIHRHLAAAPEEPRRTDPVAAVQP